MDEGIPMDDPEEDGYELEGCGLPPSEAIES